MATEGERIGRDTLEADRDFRYLLDRLGCAAEIYQAMDHDLDEAAMDVEQALKSISKTVRKSHVSLDTKVLYMICQAEFGPCSVPDIRMLSHALFKIHKRQKYQS